MKETPPSRGRLRRLTDDEIDLWLTVTKSVTPRLGSVLPQLQTPPQAPVPQAAASVTEHRPPAAPPPAPRARLPQLAPIERRLRQKLNRGQAEVEAVIDLHGLTQAEAHGALYRFLARAQAEGAKLVLIVTGKGKREGEGKREAQFEGRMFEDFAVGGVLRRAVPLWLRSPEWRGLVVGFEEAGRPHGGAGALYVRLRRRGARDR